MTIFIVFIALACGSGNKSDKSKDVTSNEEATEKKIEPTKKIGIGPIKHLELPSEIDQELAAQGEEVYNKMCLACHKPTEKFIGPAPKGILDKRTPEWIMNMILNPNEMVLNDPDAKALLIEYNMAPMANQNLTEEEARAILEYFRTL